MDNPVVDVIREYSVTYNDYVAKATIIEDNIESKAEEYLAAFAPVVTEEESERLGSIFEASNAILDELFEILGEFSDIFDDFNDINEDFNKLAVETVNLSPVGENFVESKGELKEILDKINALFVSMEQYTPVIDESIVTLREKYAKEYEEYLKSLESTENAMGEPVEDNQKVIDEASQIFDKFEARRNEAMFVDNAINAKFEEAAKLPSVLTENDKNAFTEAVTTCNVISTDLQNKFESMIAEYGNVNILVEKMASVNNIIKECKDLIVIFTCALESPYEWGAVNTAQSSVYRYEALQNDVKVMNDMLNVVSQQLKDGMYHTAGARSTPMSIDTDHNPNCEELKKLIGNLENDINDYFKHITCDENLRAWVVSRFNDVLYHAENYERAIQNISASTEINGGQWPLGIYGNEGMYGDIVGNELRECNLAASEIRKVLNKQRSRY